MKHRLRTFNQKVVVLFLKALSFLPLWFLYLKSDVLYLLVTYVVGYRRKVIDENLFYAFPEKSQKERDTIRKKFYRHFCDLTFETVKMYSMPEKDFKKRISFDLEELNNTWTGDTGVIVLIMHYNNWEWISYLQRKIDRKILGVGVYNRMRDNVPFDDFLLDSRKRWGAELVVMSNAARTAFNYKNKNIPALLWLAADQSAPQNSQFWATFLNREAPFFGGPVKLAQKLNQPLYFQRVKKVGRGKYESDFILLFKEPAKVDESEILGTYIQKMEEVIRETPEYYLWSHRRWKHTRPEGTELSC
ncbi:MAG TPA: lysophospholipid acyltransferase family protein [Draconibacterium sp.]|nr:lysophospholipid acyltransferase family protein [Draconibacterium sp.]